MRSLSAYLRAFWRGLRRPSQVDADMNDEMRFHLEMEAQRIQQQRGLNPVEANRQAAIAFGGVEKYRGAGRDAFGFTWMRGLSVDLKLGLRMLGKSPGLTVVALFALSLAIGAGAAYLEFINDLMHGTLPVAEADRIAGIQTWDQESGEVDKRQTANFVAWRESLRSFDDLAAVRTFERNLITEDGRAEPVMGVEISASAFRIAQVPPLLGRPLVEEDERGGAVPVMVIGYTLWTTRFGSDPEVVGKSVRIGNAPYTIVGVMPVEFAFPFSHSLWVPLSLNSGFYPRREGPATAIFGKLAPGMTISAAQAELNTVAERTAADFPATDRLLRPVVKPYVESLWSAIPDSRTQTIVFYSANIFFLGLLALCGANIATLVFARTATREVEISVRTALGASRARIAGQLFAEALVLSSIAAAIGLAVARSSLMWIKDVVSTGMGEPMWFWWDDRMSPSTFLYAALLAVFVALIIGVTPALKATGPKVQERLKQSTGATSSGLRFGGVWTGVIVTQVAVTVVFLAIVGILGWSAYITGGGKRPVNFPQDEYLSARLSIEPVRQDNDAPPTPEEDAAYRRQMRATYAELSRRLAAEPAVAGVTYATAQPAMNPDFYEMDIDGATPPDGRKAFDIRTTSVAPNYFETFSAPILSGRPFNDGDLAPERHVAIADRTFVKYVFNGQDAIGRQLRLAATEREPAGPWIEIVGVVADLTDDANKKAGDGVLYQPAPPDALRPLFLAVRARTNPVEVMPRLRVIAADVDPILRLTDVMTLDRITEYDRVALDFFARLLAGISIVAIILATAGVYALMSFTVARRTPEIGIRVALGANPRRIVMATFARAFLQITIGLILGSIPAAGIVAALGPEVAAGNGDAVAIGIGLASTMLVATVTALACVFPARRALRIQPTEALKTT